VVDSCVGLSDNVNISMVAAHAMLVVRWLPEMDLFQALLAKEATRSSPFFDWRTLSTSLSRRFSNENKHKKEKPCHVSNLGLHNFALKPLRLLFIFISLFRSHGAHSAW
jgi:hypothetical protein